MGALYSLFEKPPETPIENPCIRCVNLWKNNFRGLIGFFIPLFSLPWLLKYGEFHRTVVMVWLWMFWSFLWQPVAVPVTSLIPFFAFPMLGVVDSHSVCKCCFACGIAFFIIGGYVHMLLNNSDLDRRIILWIICPKKEAESIGKVGLVLKVSIAAYVTSIFSNRLIATSKLMEYIADALLPMKDEPRAEGQPNYNSMRYILANAIATSSVIGGIAIVHSSYGVLAFRAMFYEYHNYKFDYLNFLEYSMFAFPVSIFMFVVNLIYNIILMVAVCKGNIEKSKAIAIRDSLIHDQVEMKSGKRERITHEVWSAIFLVLLLTAYYTRWNNYFGWATFSVGKHKKGPKLLDVTVAAIFVVVLHIIPRTYNFLTYFKPNKWTKLTMPKVKPESTILFFKFVDKNTCYGYLFVIASGLILTLGVQKTNLENGIRQYGKFITSQSLEVAILLLSIISVLLSNVMTGVAALVLMLPFVLTMQENVYKNEGTTAPHKDLIKFLLFPLTVGLGVNFGFASPFMFTPPYFSKNLAKVPLISQIKYSIGSILICTLILWIMVSFYAPVVFVSSYLEEAAPKIIL